MPLILVSQMSDVAVVQLRRPPLNALNQPLRRELLDTLLQLLTDESVKAIVLTGDTQAFSAGADIQEFGEGLAGGAFAAPMLGEVCDAIAAASKPIVAAIAGVCMGGGLEVALACHRRVVAHNARLALPEVKLGLLPGAGGTQRLPRLIGVEAALPMILTGDTMDAAAAVTMGLASHDNEDLVTTAVATALQQRAVEALPNPLAAPPLESRTGRDVLAATAAGLSRATPAALGILEAVTAALERPLRDGLRHEGEIFQRLMQTRESRALRYGFLADRAASRLETSTPSYAPRPTERLAIIGAGTMGAGIAMCIANAGLTTLLIDSSAEALNHGISRIQATYQGSVKKGRMTAEEAERRLAAITPGLALDAARDADMVIEAVPESLDLKERIFSELDRIARPGAILATNTSTLDVNLIAAATERPEDVVGLHFFSPAHLMRLLEVVRGSATSDAVLTASMGFARRIGKIGVISRVCDGFIGNRMFEEYCRQAGFLLDEGVLPERVDRALEDWGMAMGPFAVLDLAGGDIAWAIRRRRTVEQPDRPYSSFPDVLCERGRFGQKTGAGFYRYDPVTRKRSADPEVDQLVQAHAAHLGLASRQISDAEIVARCVYALINEGARLLEERIAQRASDLDVVYRYGYGFPADRGGPMFYADECGLEQVIATMDQFSRGYQGSFWAVAPLLRDCAARRQSLAGWS